MNTEDSEFARIEREAKMRQVVVEDDDIQVYQRSWVGLTDEEISKIFQRNGTPNGFARAIEKALKEKNT